MPRVTGQTEATRQKKRTAAGSIQRHEQVTEEAVVDTVRENADDHGDTLKAVRELLSWSRSADLERRFRRGAEFSDAFIRLRTDTDEVTLLQIQHDGCAWLYLVSLRTRHPFDQPKRWEELHGKLKGIKAFSMSRKGMMGYPKIGMSKLAGDHPLEELVQAMDWMVKQLRA